MSSSALEGVNKILQNHFGILELPKTWITSDELFGAIFMCFFVFFPHLQTSRHPLQLFRRMLEDC